MHDTYRPVTRLLAYLCMDPVSVCTLAGDDDDDDDDAVVCVWHTGLVKKFRLFLHCQEIFPCQIRAFYVSALNVRLRISLY